MAVTTSPFVGRERELAALGNALDDAARGAGCIAVLAGEAGIGKTRTAAEVAGAARSRSTTVLWGTCYEGESRPYGPWIDALLAYMRGFESDEVAALLGSSAPVLSEVVPELALLIGELPAAPHLGPTDSRFRIYEAWTRTVLALPGDSVLVVLDDLHWADPSSLELLRHLGRVVRDSRLLVLCTYRDAEVDAARSLAACFAELDRHATCLRLPLASLDAAESRELVANLFEEPPPPQHVDAIVRETEGNPFFITEVARHVSEGGVGLPETIRQAVGSRLARLSLDTGRSLSIAAAFTRPFDFAVLQALTDLSEDRLLTSIEEALHAGMLRPSDEAGDSYEFAHALVRQSMYDELSPSRKIRLHRRIAQALERVRTGREHEHAAEIAGQYHRSRALPGAEHGIAYALAAAERARSAHANPEAVQLLRIARDLAVDAEPSARAEIQCHLAVAEAEALAVEEAQRSLVDGLDQLERLTPANRRPVDIAGDALWALREAGAVWEDLESLVDRTLALAGDRRDLTWARLKLVVLPSTPIAAGPLNAGRFTGFDPEAVRIAQTEGTELDYARTIEVVDLHTRKETDALSDLVRAWKDPQAKVHVLQVMIRDLALRHADVNAAAAVCERLVELSEDIGSLRGQAFAQAYLADAEAARGSFSAAAEREGLAYELIARLGRGHGLRQAEHFFRRPDDPEWGEIGELHRARASDRTIPGRNGLWHAGVAASAFARAGREVEARELLGYVIPVLPQFEPTHYQLDAVAGECADAVWVLEADDLAPPLLETALAVAAAGIGGCWLTPKELTIARMAALVGQWTEAKRWFDEARAALELRGQRPMRAVVDYDEALARTRRGLPGAEPLVASARARFEALGMGGWLGRVDALAERTGATAVAGLTRRESEVLRLVAAGRTNKQIGAELVLSVHTVERHLANVYAKIGARNRADAAAFAVRQQL